MVSEEVIRQTAAQHHVHERHICPCESWADFDEWGRGEEGETKVRQALAEHWLFGDGMRAMAEQWLASREWRRREKFMTETVESAARAAESSRKAALWALLAAVAAALGSLATAGTQLAAKSTTEVPPVVQLRLEPAPEAMKSERTLPSGPAGAAASAPSSSAK